MISFVQIKSGDELLPFVAGRGIRRKCACGFVLTDDEVVKSFRNDSIYLKAIDGVNTLGLVVLNPYLDGAEIHLCLRTIGEKTRNIFGMALNLAKTIGITTVYANFPKSYRACLKLTEDFNFSDTSFSSNYWHKAVQLT